LIELFLRIQDRVQAAFLHLNGQEIDFGDISIKMGKLLDELVID
jgi:hypothetical protein